MPKVLGKNGDSLADVYDVRGSIAGVENLHSADVSLVHEMGSVLMSERLSGTILRITTGAIAQNITWGVLLTGLPRNISRILNIGVFTNAAARIGRVMVAIRQTSSGREVPIFTWDPAVDQTIAINLDDNGAGAANLSYLRPAAGLDLTPGILLGSDQFEQTDVLVSRGVTTGFGAGTVTITAVLQLAFTELRGVASRGLPVPSW